MKWRENGGAKWGHDVQQMGRRYYFLDLKASRNPCLLLKSVFETQQPYKSLTKQISRIDSNVMHPSFTLLKAIKLAYHEKKIQIARHTAVSRLCIRCHLCTVN